MVEGAEAAVFVAEAWVTRRNSHSVSGERQPVDPRQREDAVVLIGETRSSSSQRILPIVRHPDGRFREFGIPVYKDSATASRDNLSLLLARAPNPVKRGAASDRLREQTERGAARQTEQRRGDDLQQQR
jgi:hypothetical protein